MEGDPYALVAMTIAAYAVGAHKGYLYLRGEYPRALRRMEHAIGQARARGLLGEDVLGQGYACDSGIRRGAGAYICGEETALFNWMDRGEPRCQTALPCEKGLFGKPTAENNVETLVNVLPILTRGAGVRGDRHPGPHRPEAVLRVGQRGPARNLRMAVRGDAGRAAGVGGRARGAARGAARRRGGRLRTARRTRHPAHLRGDPGRRARPSARVWSWPSTTPSRSPASCCASPSFCRTSRAGSAAPAPGRDRTAGGGAAPDRRAQGRRGGRRRRPAQGGRPRDAGRLDLRSGRPRGTPWDPRSTAWGLTNDRDTAGSAASARRVHPRRAGGQGSGGLDDPRRLPGGGQGGPHPLPRRICSPPRTPAGSVSSSSRAPGTLVRPRARRKRAWRCGRNSSAPATAARSSSSSSPPRSTCRPLRRWPGGSRSTRRNRTASAPARRVSTRSPRSTTASMSATTTSASSATSASTPVATSGRTPSRSRSPGAGSTPGSPSSTMPR